jgi:outer membrane protein assembly factor BamE (lipoprotein component of BamABCDE complex)
MKAIFFIVLLFTITCCKSYKYGTSQETVEDSNLTFGVVKSYIVKGETRQDQILKTFGAPNITTKNKENDEVWSYNKMHSEQRNGYTDFFVGDRASVSNSSKSFDLIITFDKNDIVKDYSVIATSF